MEQEPLVKIADLIIGAHKPGKLFRNTHQAVILDQLGLERDMVLVNGALRLLEVHGFIEKYGETGNYLVLRTGLLSDKLHQDDARAEAMHKANLATITGVKDARRAARQSFFWAAVSGIVAIASLIAHLRVD